MLVKRKKTKTATAASVLLSPPPPAQIPDFIKNAPVLSKQRLRRGQLAKYKEQLNQAYAPALLPLYYQKVHELLQRGDKEALRIMGDLYSLVEAKGGVNVNTQVFNSAVAGGQQPVSMDMIIRRLSEQKQQSAIDIPAQADGDGPMAA